MRVMNRDTAPILPMAAEQSSVQQRYQAMLTGTMTAAPHGSTNNFHVLHACRMTCLTHLRICQPGARGALEM